jgi:hypothetical protein
MFDPIARAPAMIASDTNTAMMEYSIAVAPRWLARNFLNMAPLPGSNVTLIDGKSF